MELTHTLGQKQIIAQLSAKDRWEAIDELIAVLAATGKIQPEHVTSITEAVKWRERCMTTGIGFGIGQPTGSSDLVQEVVMALGRSVRGVEFDAMDHQPVHLVFLSVLTPGMPYLRTGAQMLKLLLHIPFREAVMNAPDAEAMHKALCEDWGQRSAGFGKADSVLFRNLKS
jgi:mannitol/fructose-specific phosphotransferase system IIA component (Ntr-type)